MPDRGPMHRDEGKVGLLDAFILLHLCVGRVTKLDALGGGLAAEASTHLLFFLFSENNEKLYFLIKALAG